MGFQPPRIIGGGQIIQPQVSGNQFKGIEDAITRHRDRKQKQDLIDLQYWQTYSDDEQYGKPRDISYQDWIQGIRGDQQPTLFDQARDKFGYGEGQWAPGKNLPNIARGIGNLYNKGMDSFKNATSNIGNRINTMDFKTGVDGATDVSTKSMKENEIRELARTIEMDNPDSIRNFQNILGIDPTGLANNDTVNALRAIQSGNYEYDPMDENSTNKGMTIKGIITNKAGGYIPGNKTGDTNPAMLEDGEYVLNRNAVKKIGKGYLDWINHSEYPRFAFGGYVGGQAQVVRPDKMDNSKAFALPKFGSMPSMENMDEDQMNMAMELAPMLMGMQQGGYMNKGITKKPTGYQTGNYVPSGRYQKTQSQLEDEQIARDTDKLMGKLAQKDLQTNLDVENFNRQVQDRVSQEQNSLGGWFDYAFDYVAPEWLEQAGMYVDRGAQQLFNVADDPGESHWLLGHHIPKGDLPRSYYDARRVGGEREMGEYEKEANIGYQQYVADQTAQNPGLLDPTQYAYFKGLSGVADRNPYAGMSNKAFKRLYKEAMQEADSSPQALLEEFYGKDWWKSTP